jgi:hypothetical protein
MKQRIEIWSSSRIGHTIAPRRFGSVITVGNIDPVILQANPIMAALRFPQSAGGSRITRGGLQPSSYRAFEHKPLQPPSLARCFPASLPNRLFQ